MSKRLPRATKRGKFSRAAWEKISSYITISDIDNQYYTLRMKTFAVVFLDFKMAFLDKKKPLVIIHIILTR